MAVEREILDWGVRLTVSAPTRVRMPLDNQVGDCRLQVGQRDSEVRITFPGTSLASPLRLLDAQAWNEGMTAIINETRRIVADMKAEVTKGESKRKR